MRQEFGGENRDLTECQIHTAVASVDPVLVVEPVPPKALLERTSAEIERAQRRNAAASKSHIKRTRKRLRALGIKTHRVASLQWDTT